MPRIDPIQLLKCLTVLLSPSGGIRSKDEVARLASLMNKFSKKLVSKCIYIQILKATETNLLGLFMGAGGWDLAYTWLTDSIEASNWPLAQELLELLLLCPVDVDRLKTNTCPKRVKELSKDNTRPVIRTLAGKLVEQWLKIVKGEYCEPLLMTNIIQLVNECTHDVINNVKPYMHVQDIKIEETKDNLDLKMEAMYDNQANVNPVDISILNTVVEDIKMPIDIVSVSESKEQVQLSVKKNDEENSDTETLPILKISMKNGKQIISKVEDTTEKKKTDLEKNESSNMLKDKEPKSSSSGKHKDKGRSRTTGKSSSSRSSGQSSKSSSDELSSKSSLDGYSSKSSSDGHSSKSNSDKQKSGSSSSKSRDKSREDKSKSSSSRSSSSHRIKETERHKDNKSSDKSKSSSSSSRDKHESSKSGSSKSKSEKSHKDKDVSAMQDQKEKNKETLEKLQPPSIHKLGKIPKKSDSLGKKDGPSFSIEVRKPDDPKPKTIKMFNSKFRSHGLEEEAKPPPSRTAIQKKPSHSTAMPAAVPKLISPIASVLHKRTSPNRISLDTPPEKKLKLLEHTDKPGAIKLIPPKPKPVLLLESDMFMDALTASASTNKKEPKKRKRRASESKDGNPTPTEVTAPATNDASSPLSSPLTSPVRSEPKSAPLRFYQDTLETEEDRVKEIENVTDEIRRSPEQKQETPTSPVPTDKPTEKLIEKLSDLTTEKSTDKLKSDVSDSNTASSSSDSKEDNRLPGGILTYHKKKGPKKSLRWRNADELEEIQYFELDENERINVTKTFIDMKNLERVHERESFQKSRNFHDIMEEKMNYRPLTPISIDAAPIEYGKNSREKDVQTAREKTVLQSLYFHKTQIPDSAAEPDVEVHSTTDPIIIPLDDVTGSLESTNDFRNTLWPEPKGLPPSNELPPPQMFPPFGGGFPNQQFGMPSFQGMGPGNMPPGSMSGPIGAMPPVGMPPSGMPPGVMPLGAMPPGVMPPGAMPPGVMPPGAMPPSSMPPGGMPPGPMPPGMIPDLMVQGGMTDMFGNQMFSNCPMPNGDAYNMGDNMNGPPMFQQGFPMNGPQGPNNSNGPTGNNFFFNGGNRGGPRGGPRGSGPWRGKNSSGRWDGPTSRGRGGGPRINKVCIHFSKRGSCKSGDKCAYKHPGVNCPY